MKLRLSIRSATQILATQNAKCTGCLRLTIEGALEKPLDLAGKRRVFGLFLDPVTVSGEFTVAVASRS